MYEFIVTSTAAHRSAAIVGISTAGTSVFTATYAHDGSSAGVRADNTWGKASLAATPVADENTWGN
ncbi:hypothetical protein [Streptomyces sp. NPDC048516]|uniref:hypothetical protein n=1 Tax=Streptomyces sp. NPDC048516 TaxID=3365565 RepID=UPI0037220D13